MGENQDISKIIGIIMENPDIIAKIKGLADKSEAESTDTAVALSEEPPQTASEDTEKNAKSKFESKKRRRELLSALKPYVKDERAKAIDTMLSVIDVIDVMKER